MFKTYKELIKSLAENSFKEHSIFVQSRTIDNQPYVWRCQKPGTWFYGYYVAELPSALVVYGDVGELIISQGSSYNLDWLNKAIDSMDYVLEKSTFKRDYFVEEAFNSALKDRGKNPDKFDSYLEYVLETGDYDVYETCHYFPPTALWTYWALHKFVQLKKETGK